MPRQILTYKVYWNEDSFMAQVEVLYHVDGNYGADADGNRGYPRTLIDDVHILKVTNEARKDLVDVPDELKQAILASVDERI